MKASLCPVAVSVILALAACATDYTKSEALNELRVDGAEARIDISFAPGSARLTPGGAARLDRLVAAGIIRPADRVTIAAGGPPRLAAQRSAVISSELLRYGIVANVSPLNNLPPNQAILGVGRYTVTLPPCPNWSSPPQAEYTNAYRSNWGCADAVNLGLMVAQPSDLISGRTLAPADGMPAAAAVSRYLNDHVKPPQVQPATPFAGPTGGGGGGGDTGAAALGGGPPGGPGGASQ
jgi:pilus assembly protein CpaD